MKREEEKRRLDGSLFVSVVLHVVLGAALLFVLSIPYPLQQWLKAHHAEKAPVERISFVRLPNNGTNTPGKSGGDGSPVAKHPRTRPIVAPSTVPTAVPPTPSVKAPPAPEGGTGPVVGNGGPTEGVQPSFDDPRVWLPPGPVYTAPKTPAQRLDSALALRVKEHNDSLALAHSGKAPGDWTFEKNGQKYGIDQNKIYLGKLKLPTALLALLPLNHSAIGQNHQESVTRAQQQAEIFYQAQQSLNEEDFKDAVKRIRQRKEREREERKKKEQEQQTAQDKPIAEPQ